jgi:predicted phosphodiesterase
MRVAVMSDIHGFHLAFETVLADLDKTGPYDDVVIAGDLFEMGPGPEIVLELLQARGYPAILGNTDEEIVNASKLGVADGETRYALDKIGPEGVAYLEKLPHSYRVSPPNGRGPEDDLLVVHANPRNLYDRIDPDLSDDELQEVIGGVQAAAIAFGHFHVSYIRSVGGRMLIDVSAVGNPKDGDLRCKYGVLTWDEAMRQWSGTIVKLPYPLSETKEAMRNSGMPNWEKAFKKLERASYKKR